MQGIYILLELYPGDLLSVLTVGGLSRWFMLYDVGCLNKNIIMGGFNICHNLQAITSA